MISDGILHACNALNYNFYNNNRSVLVSYNMARL